MVKNKSQIINSKPQSSKLGPQTMAELMLKHKTAFISPQKGDILEGKITKLTSSEILVDIGTKSLASVLEKDRRILKSLLTSLKVGDKVNVSVLNPESEFGNTVVSLRRFNEDNIWDKLETSQKNKEKIDAIIDAFTKGGFLVSTTTGVSGFLPNSQASFLNDNANLVGQKVKVTVIELSRPLKKIIFSQKAAVDSREFEKLASAFKKGQKVTATVSNVVPFGVFALVGDEQKVEGFVHLSEISWQNLASPPEDMKSGDKFEAKVLGVESEAKRINLSIKRLLPNPYEEKLKEYTSDKKVTGIITNVGSSSLTVALAEGIEGIIKKDKIPPTMSLREGQSIEATVLSIDRNRKIILSPVLKEKPIGYR